MKIRTALALSAFAVLTAGTASAEILIDFQGQGATFDGETSVDLNLNDNGNLAILTVSATGGNLNSNASAIGVGNDDIDGTAEAITLSFSSDIELVSVDLSAVGSDASDGASVGGVSLFTGQPNFNGTSDVYTPGSPIAFAANTPIVITGTSTTSSFSLQTVTVNIVPEPGSLALLGLGSIVALRRRRRA